MFKKIIWASDASVTTERLLPVVTRLAESTGAVVVVAHVQENLTLAGIPLITEDHRALDEALRVIVDGLQQQGLQAELALGESRGGHAAEVIADLARESGADLIVAGSHNKGALAGLFLGGFTSHLLTVAPCPVLVVPRPIPA